MSLLHTIASFFDPPEEALTLLRPRVADGLLFFDDGTSIELEQLHDAHLRAFEKRRAHRVPHSVEWLKTELEKHSGSNSPCFGKRKGVPRYDWSDLDFELEPRDDF